MLKRIEINKDTSINWYYEFGVNALNLHSLLIEGGCDFCADDNIVIYVLDDFMNKVADENAVSKAYNNVNEGNIVHYALYSFPANYLVGFVVEEIYK